MKEFGKVDIQVNNAARQVSRESTERKAVELIEEVGASLRDSKVIDRVVLLSTS